MKKFCKPLEWGGGPRETVDRAYTEQFMMPPDRLTWWRRLLLGIVHAGIQTKGEIRCLNPGKPK